MAQTYADPQARQRMDYGLCPECGHPVDRHAGAGGPNCSLTDNGVAQRIAAYRAEGIEWGVMDAGGNVELAGCLGEGRARGLVVVHYGRQGRTVELVRRRGDGPWVREHESVSR